MASDQYVPSGPVAIELQIITSLDKGCLGIAEFEKHVPFEIRRVFFFYDVPNNTNRGGHAHRKQQQFMICLSGCVKLNTVSAFGKNNFFLDRPSKGILLPPMTWTDICFEEPNSTVIVLTCSKYDEADYIRDFDAYLSLKNQS
tara:strand:- start:485 stop:913 length:429 start_codon:yes stop_codon:yes gene_type:complete